jgi:3-oxoacid CoA-transferase subunit A
MMTRLEKVVDSAEAAIVDLGDGARVMVGGFGLSGNPETLIRALAASGRRDLTLISNNIGNQGRGLAVLLQNKQVKAAHCSFVGGNPDLEQAIADGSVDVELNPQGTLAERIRAGGAGIGGFYTPTGAATVIAEGKETRTIDGTLHVLETPLHADFALVRARYGDANGNLRFHRSSRNFQPLMAMAGRITIAEVEELLPVGQLDPDDIHLPGVFVQRVLLGGPYENPIEYRTTRPD